LTIDGILNLDKPRGKTSFGVVALVRKLSGERRVGHAGTLDPDATGVLPVCLGQGTRLIEYLAEATKIYQAEIELGIATDTYDAAGEITQRCDFSYLTKEQVETALSSFTGFIEQTPPMYSAVKQQGVPLYRWARAGIEMPRRARRVEVSRLEMIDWKLPMFTLEVECSKGTYIRSLAHDLGQKLGCGAHLRNLVRLKSGLFHIKDAVSISRLEDAFRQGHWAELFHPIDMAVLHLPAIIVDEENEKAIMNGRPLDLIQGMDISGKIYRAYSREGRFIAILHYDEIRSCWKPGKVFRKRDET
jgi:tRNA pseudouridine55 synthase